MRVHSGFSLTCGSQQHTIQIGSNFHVRRWCSVVIDGRKLSIGRNVFMNNRCSISCLDQIIIGDDCLFGEGVSVYDHDHNLSRPGLIRDNGFKRRGIKIGNNVWFGTNVVILRGTTIGDNVVVGANTLVRGVIPSNTLAIGMGRSRIEMTPLRQGHV